MIPATKDITVTSTLVPEDTIHMSIDPRAAKHLMNILAGIYSDNIRAVIREYITNALDSHVEAGQTRPVEVTSPSRLQPYFEVEDFGVGMSVDDIRNIYALYGASTKRETQDQTGSIGIGAKSALAYGTQFTVNAAKDGEQAVVLVSLDESGNGIMEVLSITKTDRPNGVKITIPVTQDHFTFNNRIAEFHRFVTPGKVLVDGHDADRSMFRPVSDNLSIMEVDSNYGCDYVVMGNVAYPIDSNYGRINRYFRVVVHVDMGEVHFTPSREELTYDSFTRRTLDKYKDEFNENLIGYLQQSIDQANNRREAFNVANQLRSRLSWEYRDTEFTYNDEELPTALQEVTVINFHHYTPRTRAYQIVLTSVPSNSVFVKNWTNKRFTSIHMEKVNKYREQNAMTVVNQIFLLPAEFDDHGLFDDIEILDYDDVRKIKINTGTNSFRNKVREYEGLGGGRPFGKRVPDATKNIWYGSKTEVKRPYDNRPNWATYMKNFDNVDDEFYYVTDAELTKFKKTYPNARHYLEYYVDKINNYLDSLTDEDREVIKYQDKVHNFQFLIASELKDPDLYKSAAYKDIDATIKLRYLGEARDYLRHIPIHLRAALEAKFPESFDTSDLMNRYPLLSGNFYRHDLETEEALKRHMTDYCNSIYEGVTMDHTTNREEA